MTRAELMQRLNPASARGSSLWELYHENSKTTRYDAFPQPEFVTQQMKRMLDSHGYDQYPEIELPPAGMLDRSLSETLTSRVSARGLSPARLPLQQVATLLESAYGVTRDNIGTEFPRPFRTVPSGGALYPLELYFHSANVEELEAGLYHYNPSRRCLRFLRYGDETRRLSAALVQRNLAVDASLIIFITAVFDRSIFKYGDRGYRFTLIEAGHVAQNLALVAAALGLGCVTVGGYSDRQVDDLLGLDGIAQSTVYLAAVGEPAEYDAPAASSVGH